MNACDLIREILALCGNNINATQEDIDKIYELVEDFEAETEQRGFDEGWNEGFENCSDLHKN